MSSASPYAVTMKAVNNVLNGSCRLASLELAAMGRKYGLSMEAMIAALNIAHELLKSKSGKNVLDSGDAKRRINSMSKMIDQTIAEQDKLF